MKKSNWISQSQKKNLKIMFSTLQQTIMIVSTSSEKISLQKNDKTKKISTEDEHDRPQHVEQNKGKTMKKSSLRQTSKYITEPLEMPSLAINYDNNSKILEDGTLSLSLTISTHHYSPLIDDFLITNHNEFFEDDLISCITMPKPLRRKKRRKDEKKPNSNRMMSSEKKKKKNDSVVENKKKKKQHKKDKYQADKEDGNGENNIDTHEQISRPRFIVNAEKSPINSSRRNILRGGRRQNRDGGQLLSFTAANND